PNHPPQEGWRRGDPTRQSPVEPIKALAFNTLLSSQEMDTHRTETRSHGPRPRGNPSNLPGSPSLSRRPNKIFLTDDRFTRPPRHDTPTGTRPAEDRFVGDALRAGHPMVSSIPFWAVQPSYISPSVTRTVF